MKFLKLQYTLIAFFVLSVLFFHSCSTTKFVPDDKYLLNTVDIKSDTKDFNIYEARQHIAQNPNFKTFTIFKFPLFVYNLSGQDSTKWINRTLRNAGDPPVIFDSLKVGKTVKDLTRMMTNKGYLDAQVVPDIKLKSKKADIIYNIKGGTPYRINRYNIDIPDSVIVKPEELRLTGLRKSKSRLVVGNLDSLAYMNQLVDKNSIFDLAQLDQERDRITSLLRHTGYYAFNKEYIGFEVDTMVGNHQVDVDMIMYPLTLKDASGNIIESKHRQYTVETVELYVDYDPIQYGDISEYLATDVYQQDGYIIKYGERGRYIKPHVILNNCFISPNSLYNEMLTTHTYTALSQLKILKNVNITYHLVGDDRLRCIITCVPDKRQGISTEVEGTNSGGFFGLGAGIGYLHRNAFKGSELFKVGLKGSYEMMDANFTNFDKNFFEIGGETSLTFPRFMLPFLNEEFKRTANATTQLNAGYTYQRRPGYFTRTIMYTGLKYQWNDRLRTGRKHTVDLIDINYVHLPKDKLEPDFLDELSESARRYSFSDQFIVGTGYTISQTNLRESDRKKMRRPIYSFRASVETAGNTLSLISKLVGGKKDEDGVRELFGTKYAQYIKGTFDYSKTYTIDERNSFAWRIGGGIAYPYGNYREIPIQKRFFSGGGNSLRGWSVRSVGPGSYKGYKKSSTEDRDNFYYHSGDIKLDMNIEYRSKLFWIIELGAFIDAGNIWTVHNNEGIQGGKFYIDKFYEQIAVSWGLGIRLDFDFFLLRLDCGWKAFNPAGTAIDSEGQIYKTERWPIKYPYKFGKNAALHIAVGYPF